VVAERLMEVNELADFLSIIPVSAVSGDQLDIPGG
jgi:hypothetical protein